MDNKLLLFSITKKDLKVDYFSGTGAGGQYRNKHQNCVRLHHPDSGVITTGQSERSRQANLKEALNNLVAHPKFKLWHSQKVKEVLDGETIQQKVDSMMSNDNLMVECKDEDGKWVPLAMGA